MEDFVQNLISQGPWGIVSGAIVYLIVFLQRNSTKKERDADSEQMKTRIALLENEVNRLKDLDLEAKLAQILTDLAWLKDRMK
jgi:cell division protein FtsB